MKKIMFIVLAFVIANSSIAQIEKGSNAVINQMSITVDEAFVKASENNTKISLPTKLKFSSKIQYQYYNAYNGSKFGYDPGPGNELTASLIDTIYQGIAKIMKDSLDINVMPLNELTKLKNPMYSAVYPDLPEFFFKFIKKQTEAYKYYISVNVKYSVAGLGLGIGNVSAGSGKPLVDIKINISDNLKIIYTYSASEKLDEKTGSTMEVEGIDNNALSNGKFVKVRNNLSKVFYMALPMSLNNKK